LLDDYDREELAEMIEYTKESKFDSHFYTNNTFEDVIVRDGNSVDYYVSEPEQSVEEDTSQIHIKVGASDSNPSNEAFETTVLLVIAQLIFGVQPFLISITALIGLSFTLLYKYLEER
jgi:hypothetical protein